MCSQRFSKIILVILNILFILLGLGLLIPGILVIADEETINDEIFPALQSVSVGVSNLGDLAKGLSITMIVIGSFILVLSLLGCMGACCEVKCMLVIYIVVVILLFIGKLVIVILWIVFNADVRSTLKEEMKKGLNKFTNDDLTTDEVSTGWNYLNMEFDCCGIESSTDYTTTAWKTGGASENVPISCCTGAAASSYPASKPAACDQTAKTNINTAGCFDAIESFANKYSIAFICVGVFILLLEIAVIIFACIVCKKSGKDQMV